MITLREQWNALYAAGKVRWMPGMLAMFDPELVPRVIGSAAMDYGLRHRVTGVERGRWYGVTQHHDDYPDALHENESGESPESFPDFADPATVGCLLEQAREAWDSPRLQTSPMLQPAPLEWICYPNACEDDGRRYIEATEPAAILAAIAAAPTKGEP